ncbi:MAG: ATP-binding protein, partial [Steroidobacteraceae bacterium]
MDLIRVGSFEVFPGERLLCCGGKAVEIGSRAFDLLLVLAENPGRLVTKSTLIERVWPRLVVDENNLPAQIASLRRVLGAGAIRTVPRFGYRLDLPVSRATPPGEPAINGVPGAVASLPAPRRVWSSHLGPLVGRATELDSVRRMLDRERLVTLVGAAGVGKSRLAQEVLARDPAESEATTAFVSLESLDSIERLPSAIALAVGISLPESRDGFRALAQALGGLRVLLVLDGAEHLAASLAAPLSTLVSQLPGLGVLVTSQVPLGRVGEAIYRLGALPVADAVVMFGQRASLADQRFEISARNEGLVKEICRQLDGNPLAVELAAARVAAFGLAGLLEHLDDRFRLLRVSGTPQDSRHGVLQAAFDWSYELLAPAERRVFDGLGAFAGSFSLATA